MGITHAKALELAGTGDPSVPSEEHEYRVFLDCVPTLTLRLPVQQTMADLTTGLLSGSPQGSLADDLRHFTREQVEQAYVTSLADGLEIHAIEHANTCPCSRGWSG